MTVSSIVVTSRGWPWRLAGAVVLSLVTYFGARALLELDTLATAWRVVVAIAPVPFFAWVLYEIVRSSRRFDELERRVQLEALAVAYPLALVLLMLLGLLELAIPLDKDDWSYRHVWQMQGAFYFIGLFLAWRRYGAHEK